VNDLRGSSRSFGAQEEEPQINADDTDPKQNNNFRRFLDFLLLLIVLIRVIGVSLWLISLA